MFLMAMKYTNIFHSKGLQNIPKLVFLVMKINHLAALMITAEREDRKNADPGTT
jgi:hypothetical protein